MTKHFVAVLFILGAYIVSFASTAEPATGKQVRLRVGQRAHVGSLTLEFLSVVQDSRCPVNVQCITAGNAKVQIRIKDDKGEWITAELNTTTQPIFVVHGGQEIRLLEILPKPREGATPKQSDYIASFSIGTPSSTPTPTPMGTPEQS